MTEQEAIKNINTYIYSELESIPKQLLESLKLACFTLNEIQQYRAIGTPEECREAVDNVCDWKYKHAGGYEWSYAYKYYDVDKVVDQIKTLSPANYVSKDDVLKIVKGDNFSQKSEKNSFFNFDEVLRIECEKARTKAIDDFTNELKLKCLENMYHSVTLDQIFEIKEQLKGGADDE